MGKGYSNWVVETASCARAVALAQQGQWVRWDGIEKRKNHLGWAVETNRTSFIIRATYDVYPSPENLHLRHGEDSACSLCTATATFKHILAGWKISLTQRRYTWHHNQVLRCLASAFKHKRFNSDAIQNNQTILPKPIVFIREGEMKQAKPTPSDWTVFPQSIKCSKGLGNESCDQPAPDLVLWSNSCCCVFIVKLMAPWEDSIERKKLLYATMAAEAEERGGSVKVCPVDKASEGSGNQRADPEEDHQKTLHSRLKEQSQAMDEKKRDSMGNQMTT